MANPSPHPTERPGFVGAWNRGVRRLVLALSFVAGLGILFMTAVTCLDVVLRFCRMPLRGAYDLVVIAGALTIACGLPYTTAVKGHVAIEYFFQKLSRRGRILVDTVVRLIAIALFAVFTWEMYRYGHALRAAGQVMLTLQIPMFWIPWVFAVSCGVTILVIVYNMLYPGREMIRP